MFGNAATARRLTSAPHWLVIAKDFSNAPVHDEDLAKGPDHYVLRFEVSVDNVVGVGKSNGFAGGPEQPQSLVESHGLDNMLIQSLAANILHDIEDPPVRK